jgi:hypothetical protein
VSKSKFDALTDCEIETGGDLKAARLLLKLRQLITRASQGTYRDGKKWIVNTREQWIELLGGEEAGWTRHAYDRVMHLLRRKGLIVVLHAPHPFKTGVLRATWVRPISGGETPQKPGNQSSGLPDNPSSAEPDHPSSAGPDDPYISNPTSYPTSYKSNLQLDEVPTTVGPETSGTLKGGQDEMEGKKIATLKAKGGKVADIMKKPPEKMTSGQLIALSKPKASELALYWKQHAGGYQPPMDSKTLGQLSLLLKKLPSAAAVIVKVLEDWQSFAVFVVKQTGKGTIPENPHIGYVLSNAHLAKAFLEGSPEIQPEDEALNFVLTKKSYDKFK